jgi:hypothetical protein
LTDLGERLDRSSRDGLMKRKVEHMSKSFEARELIQLPNLSAGAAIALGTKLFAVAEAEKRLPAKVAKASQRLKQSHKKLARAERDRVRTEPATEEHRNRTRMEENTAWTAFQFWRSGWATRELLDEFAISCASTSCRSARTRWRA